MNDRRPLRRDENADQEHTRATRRERRENPDTASILALQASAGNRAVTARLELQRDPTDQAPAPEPANEGTTTASGTISIPEMDLVMPILSFSQQTRGTGQPKESSGDVAVTIAMESLDPRIAEAVAKGRQFDTITVMIGSQSTFTLRSVVFTSFQVSSDTATLSLNFASSEFSPGG